MEKLISEEERIRRAEEISARRNNRIPVSNINNGYKKKMSFLTKVFIQVICSICIFGIFYFLNQNNSLAIEKIKPILTEDTDFILIYNQINDFFKNIIKPIDENNINEINEENIIDNEIDQNTENNINEENANEIENNNEIESNTDNQVENVIEQIEENNEVEEVGIGGGNDQTDISQTDQDIIFIKENASFIKPVVGYITSGYGEREPTDIISANHAGVDIGANTGTEIIASMSGVVELVSSYGDYGNHIKIVNGEISTLYAHCSTILVNQGDYIEQGQKIAEVGNTGRTTGPHLHFEIRRNNITVDPQKILDL